MWLYLSLELVYISLLLISCTLLSVQLCIRAWFPSTQRWGQLLNAFAAVFTVLGGVPRLFTSLFCGILVLAVRVADDSILSDWSNWSSEEGSQCVGPVRTLTPR